MQVLIVSDIAAGVLFDDAVELGLSQVLHLPLSVSPPFLRHHGLLQSQVAAGDLAEGDNSQKLLLRTPVAAKSSQDSRFKDYPSALSRMNVCVAVKGAQCRVALHCTLSASYESLVSSSSGLRVFVSEGQELWVDTHQPAQQFTAKGCAAAVSHGKSHLVDELLQPIHALQGLAGHLAGNDTHARTHVVRALAELFTSSLLVAGLV